MRVVETSGADVGVFANLKYVVTEQMTNLHWKQVFSVYAFAAALVACCLICAAYLDYDHEYLLWLPVIVLGLVPYLLRRRARRRPVVDRYGRPAPIE
jgi:hypothetical protein